MVSVPPQGQAVADTGTVVAYHEYDPYGNPTDDGPLTTDYGYTGEWWKSEIRLLHYKRMNSLKSLAINCGPLSEMILGLAWGNRSPARWRMISTSGSVICSRISQFSQ